MHADELRMAVAKIVGILNKTDIRTVVDQYRSAKGDQRTPAAARLGHAGAVLMERVDSMSASEKQVVKCLHLDSLGSPEYWQDLLGSVEDPRKHQAEIVRLASRVMFAGSHLPAMLSLLDTVKPAAIEARAPTEVTEVNESAPKLLPGEGRLCIRLTDAGERASDPDRVARAIDGIDMLYSACASIARKPAMDLRMDGVLSMRNRDRDLLFTGDQEGITAVYSVIDSIPAVLADIDPEQDIDLDAIVRSLPVFEDLTTLISLGSFSKKDMKDISDTMHQGALLALESGVILVDIGLHQSAALGQPSVVAGSSSPAVHPYATSAHDGRSSPSPMSAPASAAGLSGARGSRSSQSQAHHELIDEGAATLSANSLDAPETDEHYARYLKEREAMLHQHSSLDGFFNGHTIPTLNAQHAGGASRSEDQIRREAAEELLKSLGQSRNS